MVNSMCILKRKFKIEDEHCVSYIPERPNGFGVMIIGDYSNYITENGWFWEDSLGRLSIINKLLESGYTIFSVNLTTKHWGNENAFSKLVKLYHYIIRHEIINKKIHLLTEGIGAVFINELVTKMGCIRSITCIDPHFNLKDCISLEENQKIFYKRTLNEISDAYQIRHDKLNNFINNLDEQSRINTPVRIYTSIKHTLYQKLKNNQIHDHCHKYLDTYSLKFYMDDSKYSQIVNLVSFLNKYEEI
jgi:hypothetical protein